MRQRLEPGPDHPITTQIKAARVRIIVSGVTIIDTASHIELSEANYPHVAYLPRAGVDMSALVRSDHTSWCPYKGEANYFHIRRRDGSLSENAIWTYEDPFPAVASIKDALGIYPDRVDAILFD